MSYTDQVSTSIGVNSQINRQQAKHAALLSEMASGTLQSSMATALATPLQTEVGTISVVQQNVSIAGSVLSSSQQALSSVSGNLMQMLSTATAALSATGSTRETLSQQFNQLLAQTQTYVGHADVNGINLVSSGSERMTVNTTTHGGQLTVNGQASDASSLGVSSTGASGWTDSSSILSSMSQVQSALNQLTNTQARFAAAQSALGYASQVNQSSLLAAQASEAAVSGADIGAVAAGAKSSQAQSELAISASAQENKLDKSVLELFKHDH